MKNRNNTIDIIRGFAMFLVVLGHTISESVIEYSDCLFFKIIWTLQMPLFIIISGYVTRYSYPITNSRNLWKFVKKRTLAYLLPWVVWIIVVRGIVYGQTDFLNLKYMLWHMDTGYWFLVTIWTISMIFGFADFLSNKFFCCKQMNVATHLVISCIGLIGLSVVGYYTGIDFFCIKLTLYYLPFFLIGYLYGQVQNWLLSKVYVKMVVNYVIVLSLGIWLAIINRFDFYLGEDSIAMIALRFITSMLGCISVIGLFITSCDGGVSRVLKWMGIHSLEIYLTHYLFLGLISAMVYPTLASMEGVCLILMNFGLTLLLSIVFIKVVKSNTLLNYVLYAKH